MVQTSSVQIVFYSVIVRLRVMVLSVVALPHGTSNFARLCFFAGRHTHSCRNIPPQLRKAGIEPTWFVDAEDVKSYQDIGLKAGIACAVAGLADQEEQAIIAFNVAVLFPS